MKSKFFNVLITLTAVLAAGVSGAWAAITVNTQPTNQTVTEGTAATLTVAASTDDQNIAYQWKKADDASKTNAADVSGGSGATTASYTTPTNLTAGTHYYYVAISDDAGDGDAESDVVTVTVNAAGGGTPPANVVANITITAHPRSENVAAAGSPAALTVAASEANGLQMTYQWYESPTSSKTAGTAIAGAAQTSYTPAITAPGTYYYYAEVSAGAGNFKRTVTSNVAVIRKSAGATAKIDDAIDGLWDLIKGTNASQTQVLGNLTLSTAFPAGSPAAGVKIAWTLDSADDAKTRPFGVIAMGAANAAATVTRPDFDYVNPTEAVQGDGGRYGRIVLSADLTDTTASADNTHTQVLTLLVPRKLDISSSISFADTVLTYTGSALRIPSATIGSAIGAATFEYTYHTGGTATEENMVAGPYSGTLTPTGLTLTHPTTGTPAPGVTKVDDYWVKVRVNSASANAANPCGGEAVAKMTVKGKALQAGAAKVQGTYTYTGADQPVNLEVKDGNTILAPGTHYTVETVIRDAGLDSIKVTGVRGSNYSNLDTVKVPITVAKKVVAAVVDEIDPNARTYDASDTLDRGNLAAALDGLIAGDNGYFPTVTIKRAVYTPNGNATVNPATKASAANGAAGITVALDWTGVDAKNYAFAGGADTAVVKLTGLLISKRTLEAGDVDIDIPDDHLFTGAARAIPVAFSGEVPYREPAGGGKLTVLFDYSDSVSSAVPVKAGAYAVSVAVVGGVNFTGDTIPLGANYVIGEQKRPTLDPHSGDTADGGGYYHSQIVRLGVAQEFAGDADGSVRKGCALSYQWYRNDTLIAGATDSVYRFTVDTTKMKPNPTTGAKNLAYAFKVRIVTKYPGQADAVDTSGVLAVKVLSGQVASIADATVKVSGSWTYDGSAQEPAGSEVSVTYGGAALAEGTDYALEYSENVNAGDFAIVRIIGAGRYGEFTERAFRIAKRDLDPAVDLQVRMSGRYNAAAHPIDSGISLSKTEAGVARTGLGAVKEAFYIALDEDGEPTADTLKTANPPVDAGNYDVWVTFKAGVNFNAYDAEPYNVGVYSIIPRTVGLADFTGYALPPAAVAWDGLPHGITGAVALPGSGYGDIVVRYNGDTAVPSDTGAYTVTAQVTGGRNYIPTSRVTLGAFRITGDVSVASTDRVIPASRPDGSAVVAPAAAVAGEFSVGPNPVAKASGKVAFFWNGGALRSGTLYVYDASGSLVTKVAVAGAGKGAKGAREIGSWNLADAKGRPVADGAYLVKGALVTKDGGKIRVSSIVGVATR